MQRGLGGVCARAGGAALAKLLALAPDTRERHAIVGELAGEPRRVLDVGGVPGALAPHLPRSTEIVTVNVEPPADILMEGVELPLEDGSFELVTSVDVLEHIPPADRTPFVAELVRVAAKRVVLCCPFGSAEHRAAESELLDWYARRTGERHRWLGEHVEHGLPTQEELRAAFAPWLDEGDAARVEFLYHGDFRSNESEFKTMTVAMADGVAPKLSLAWRWARHRRELRLSKQPTPWTNRVFVRVER